jgi:hypothetical protein
VHERVEAGGPKETVRVEPYGTFDPVEAALGVENLLFRYEAAAGNWERALALAEERIERVGESHAGSWILTKASLLAQLGRLGEAKALLLRNLDPRDPDSETHRMLRHLGSHTAAG